MAGLHFEEFTVGQHFVHEPRLTVKETEHRQFCLMTHNTQPLHLDADFARAHGEFGGILVNSLYTLAFMIGVSVADTTEGTTVGNLGMEEVRFAKPVRLGDTLRAETRVVALRDSRSRPQQGIVTFEHRCFNQRDEEVASCRRAALMQRRRQPASHQNA